MNEPSKAGEWNWRDTGNTLLWSGVSLLITQFGPDLITWLDSQGGWVAYVAVPVVTLAGRALWRFSNDNRT